MLRWIVRVLLGLVLVAGVALAAGVRLDLPAAEVEARWVGPPSKFVEVDGLRIHVRDRGSGPALVLIHGSNSSLFTWEGWARELGAGRRIVTLDLPGHGLTGPDPRGRYAPAQMAAVVDRVTRALGLARFSVGGSSMGGQVAVELALAYPERVDKLILVDSLGLHREEPRPLMLRFAGAPILGNLFTLVTPRFAVAASVRDVFGDPSKVTDALVDRYDELLRRDGNREATRLRLSGPDQELATERLAGLSLPVLILWGEKDRWTLPKYGERFRAAIPGAKLVVFPGLGHVPMEEDPVATARVVKDFL